MKIFENYNSKGKVKSFDDFKLSFSHEDVVEEYKCLITKEADSAANTDVPMLPAKYYRDFILNGNRSRFEIPHSERRTMLMKLIVGEFAHNDGRYIDALIDVIWAICEETTWVAPAHNADKWNTTIEKQLGVHFEDDICYIDLFSAVTGAQLALAWYLFRDKLEAACPDTIVKRIEYELRRRIIHPTERNYMNFGWSGMDGCYVNNWNPWISSNILTVAALFEQDLSKREKLTQICCDMVDNYINRISEDGCCDEGASYYWISVGAVFNYLEMFDEISVFAGNLFENELLKRFAEHIMKVHIAAGKQFVTFCDCPRFLEHVNFATLSRVGKLLGSEQLVKFAGKFYNTDSASFSCQLPYTTLKGFATKVEKSEYEHEKCYYFDVWQIMTARNTYNGREIFVGAKAGANNEGHGHLDNGSFVLYIDGKPVFLDVGAPTYTKDTFNENRLKYWAMRSPYHNTASVDSYEQFWGNECRTTDVVRSGNALSMEMKECYPCDSGIVTLKRTIDAEAGFTVTDTFEFDSERTYKFNLITAVKPVVCGNVLAVDTPDGIHAEFELSAKVSVECEEMKKRENDRCIISWDTDRIYRTVLSISAQKGEFVFKLK